MKKERKYSVVEYVCSKLKLYEIITQKKAETYLET